MGRVRLQDVAAVAGVSMKTVSNVVHRSPHVSEAMRERVQRAIDDLGYRPNALGRRLATGRTGMLALSFSDVSLPYFSELAHTVSAEAARRGYRVLLEQTGGTLEGERATVSSSEAGLVDGVLFQPSVMSSAEIAQHRDDVPLVLLGEGPAPLSVDRVMVDNVLAAATATRHLAALGRTRIAFLGHEAVDIATTSSLRLQGYQQGLEQSGLPLDMELLLPSAELNAAGAAESLRAALDRGVRFDALVCREDLAAIGALRVMHEAGMRVPEDVAIIGWDDIALSRFTHPSLSTIRANSTELVGAALDMLEERISGFTGLGRHRIVDFELVLRESAPAIG